MNKYDLSVLIPARNEMFLSRTVDDILRKKQGNTEVIVALDGEWAEPGIPDHEDVTIIYFPKSIGQRAATNQAARLSKAKYVMKLDAHCAVDEGFDVKLMADMQDDWTVIPTMYNLHGFDWVCIGGLEPIKPYTEEDRTSNGCGHRSYQGPTPEKCEKCGGRMERLLLWQPRFNRRSYYYRFDSTLHFKYFGEYGNRPEAQGDVVPMMSVQGSCFFLTREKYWELNICDERHGSWGNQGTEVACATWLSGGQVMVNKKTWYSHLFRTQGSDFGFPYPLSGNAVEKARTYSRDLWLNNKHPKQIRPLSWLLEKFWPVPDWSEEDLNNLKLIGSKFINSSVPLSGKEGVAGLAMPLSTVNVRGEQVSSLAIDHLSFPSTRPDSSQHINPMTNKTEMDGITTQPITTDVINDGNILSKTAGDGGNQPSIHDSVDSDLRPIETDSSVSEVVGVASPDPTTANTVNSDFGEKSNNEFSGNTFNSEHSSIIHSPHYTVEDIKKSREIIFYTDNQLKLKYAHAVQNSLRKTGLPIISSSLKPMPHFGNNIHIPRERGMETYFMQIIAALEKSTADIVYMCEHDVVYHPSHFEFIPERKDKFYYNLNFWRIRPEQDNLAVHWDANQVSGLVAYRELLLDWYKKKWEKVQREGFDRSYEPGGRNSDQIVTWKSEYPNIDIRHGKNLTKSKWSLHDFRDKSTATGWQESTVDKIPGWKLEDINKLFP